VGSNREIPVLSRATGATLKVVGGARSQRASLALVSVIIPYYKQAAFILDTVMSVKRQTYPNIELIVVDDGSPVPAAPSLVGVEGLTLYETGNSGCPGARNYGFERSSGEYLVFLDGDDLLTPRAIEMNLELLQGSPKAALSFGAMRIIDNDGNEMMPARIPRARLNYFSMLLETNPIWSSGATMIRRETFVKAGMFRVLRRFQVDDYDLYLQLARQGNFVQHPSCVLEYRRHGGNMSNDRPKMLAATLEVLDRLAEETPLTAFQRLQLWHGRKRWMNTFQNEGTVRGQWLDRYFRIASAWNLRGDALILEVCNSVMRQCGWEATHSAKESSIVPTGIKGTKIAR
jgi:glycosyltransferase involved in cell wall biosynthesis